MPESIGPTCVHPDGYEHTLVADADGLYGCDADDVGRVAQDNPARPASHPAH